MSYYDRDMALIREDIDTAMNQVVSEYRDRNKILRSSGLPYCSLRELYAYCLWINDGNKHKYWYLGDMDTGGLAYVGIGTLIHELFQNMLTRGMKNCTLIGNFDAGECTRSQCPHKKNRVAEMDRKGCLQCKKQLPYREMHASSSFTSHLDIALRINGTNRVYFIDIKTTAMQKVWGYNRSGKGFPQNNYVFQVDSYAVNFTPQLEAMGLKLVGSAIWYAPRDRPTDVTLVPVEKKYTRKRLNKIAKLLDQCNEGFMRMNDILGIKRSRGRREITKEDVAFLTSKKLCISKEYYDDKVHDQWNPCPLAAECFSKSCKKSVAQEVKRTNRKLLKGK